MPQCGIWGLRLHISRLSSSLRGYLTYRWAQSVWIVKKSGVSCVVQSKIKGVVESRRARVYRKLQKLTRIDRAPLPITRRTGDW